MLDAEALTEALFETSDPLIDVAKSFDVTVKELRERIEELGLGWVAKGRGVSRGQAAILGLMRELLPGEDVVVEEYIGERLRLDVYCPSFRVAAEYHGRQHFEFVKHFHRDAEGFKASQERDKRKQELCEELGIVLVVFTYKDNLSKSLVFSRLLEAIKAAPPIEEEEKVVDPYNERMKERAREYRKKRYRQWKREQKNRGR